VLSAFRSRGLRRYTDVGAPDPRPGIELEWAHRAAATPRPGLSASVCRSRPQDRRGTLARVTLRRRSYALHVLPMRHGSGEQDDQSCASWRLKGVSLSLWAATGRAAKRRLKRGFLGESHPALSIRGQKLPNLISMMSLERDEVCRNR